MKILWNCNILVFVYNEIDSLGVKRMAIICIPIIMVRIKWVAYYMHSTHSIPTGFINAIYLNNGFQGSRLYWDQHLISNGYQQKLYKYKDTAAAVCTCKLLFMHIQRARNNKKEVGGLGKTVMQIHALNTEDNSLITQLAPQCFNISKLSGESLTH